MSTLSSANVTDVNLVLKERTHMHLRINMLIFTHNLGNWLMPSHYRYFILQVFSMQSLLLWLRTFKTEIIMAQQTYGRNMPVLIAMCKLRSHTATLADRRTHVDTILQ